MKLRLQNQPVAYEKVAKAVVYLLVGFGIVVWTDSQIVLVLAVIESVLGLIVWASVTPNVKVNEKVATAAASARSEALADVASLALPKPAKKAAKNPAKKAPATRR